MKTMNLRKEVICEDDSIRIEKNGITYVIVDANGDGLEIVKVDKVLSKISINPINGNSIAIK